MKRKNGTSVTENNVGFKAIFMGNFKFQTTITTKPFPKFLGWLLEPLATQEFNFK